MILGLTFALNESYSFDAKKDKKFHENRVDVKLRGSGDFEMEITE